MSKVELTPVTSGYNLSTLNNNFQEVENELNNKVLYREHEAGEPNHMSVTLDMNSNDIINVNELHTKELFLDGSQVFPTELASDIALDELNDFKDNLASGSGSSLVGFIQAGTGAVAWSLQDKVRERISVKDFDVVANGTDEKVNIQKAIDYASSLGGKATLIFEPGKTYVTGGLIPKSGVLIDLQGSTLKLADNANTPIFFDLGAGNGKDFGVVKGVLDCNQANNAQINVIGGVWLTGWSGLDFSKLDIINCLRIGLNLVECSHITIDHYKFKDSGVAGISHHSYALVIDGHSSSSRFISVKNVEVSDVIGFGIHFFGCADFDASNLGFFNLTFGTNEAIAITFSMASRGSCNNVIANQIDGDSIEINGCEDLTLDNYRIISTGKRALLTGDGGFGDNKRLKIRNFSDVSGLGAFSAALNNLIDCELDGISFTKDVSTVSGQANMRGNIIRSAKIVGTVSNNPVFTAYDYFKMEDVEFTDYTFKRFNDHGALVSGFQSPLANGAAINLPFSAIFGATLMSNQGAIAGTLKTICRFTGAFTQGSYQTCSFLVNDSGTAANLSTITQVNNATTRALTITGDATNKRIVLTNGTGVDLGVSWTLEATFFT